jgi:lysozyme
MKYVGFVEQLRFFENRVPYAYSDSRGYLTIGDGILVDKRRGGGLFPEEMDYIRNNRRGKIELRLDHELPWWRSQNEPRQTVLLLMAWQLGVEGLLGFHRTLELWAKGDYSGAAASLRDSLWHAQTPMRCERMATQLQTGDWVEIPDDFS